MPSFLLLAAQLFTIVWLNCENLLDCQHWKKADNIAKAVLTVGGIKLNSPLPDVVGLCEVRRDSVMEFLTRRTALGKYNYRYVMTHSSDERAIDVALVYDEFSLRPLRHYGIRVQPKKRGWGPTRDILYVEGLVYTGDTIHFFLVHAPSRVGPSSTGSYRKAVAMRLVGSIDSVRAIHPGAKIVAMGDFNAERGEQPIAIMELGGMVEASAGAMGGNEARGTYKFRGRWLSLDHIFVSGGLVGVVRSSRIHDPYFLLRRDANRKSWHPRRSFLGEFYDRGGCSDHLPLVLDLSL